MSDPEAKGRNRVAKKIARMAARWKMGEAKCADSRIPSFPLSTPPLASLRWCELKDCNTSSWLEATIWPGLTGVNIDEGERHSSFLFLFFFFFFSIRTYSPTKCKASGSYRLMTFIFFVISFL